MFERHRHVDEWEVREAILLLEGNGYIVRKPSEAELPVSLEVMPPDERSCYEIGVRADTKLNGVPYAFVQRFPVDRLLDPDDSEFRDNVLPRIMGKELGYYIAGKLSEGLAAQVKSKINPLVPEKRMSLNEIVGFIAYSLGTSKHRIDPQHFDESDNRRS